MAAVDAHATAATRTRERTRFVTKPQFRFTQPLLCLAAGAIAMFSISFRCGDHRETHTHIDAGPGAVVVHVVNEEPADKSGR